MRKLTIATILVGTLGFGTSLLACGGKNYSNSCGDNQNKCGSQKSMNGVSPKGGCDMDGRGNAMKYLIDAIMIMDLTKEQEDKINALMKEHMDSVAAKTDLNLAFGDNKFDKKKFIEVQNKRDIMVQSKADMIDKMYQVLTKEQKAELKAELNNFSQTKNQRSCGDKPQRGCDTKEQKRVKGCN
ncbi:MAG: Spy/CpxP family protein refolding chaperone [Arcobacteraceae bacterium]|nr:Spy/CpxP family protein refolding chaperone [Arcobacteraceae bacterium]